MGLRIKRKAVLLFELMISVVVISTVLLFIARAYAVSRKSLKRSTASIQAVLLLEDKLWELEEAEEVKTGYDAEDFKGRPYGWKMSAQSLDNSELNLVTLDVFRQDSPESDKFSVVTYFKSSQW